MSMCTICGEALLEGEGTHLSLHVIGSEGINVCTACQIALSKVATQMKEIASRSALRAMKSLKNSITEMIDKPFKSATYVPRVSDDEASVRIK